MEDNSCQDIDCGNRLPERRKTVRDSTIKLDKALDHLSRVLDHIRIGETHKDFSNQIRSINTTVFIGFTLTWIVVIIGAVLFFMHARDQSKLETTVQVSALKIENLEKEIKAIKEHDKELEETLKATDNGGKGSK